MDISKNMWSVMLPSGFRFNIPLYYATTVIYCGGGTGKSFIFNQLQELKSQCKLKRSLLLINELNIMDCAWITQLKDTLVIIDNYEVVREVYPEIVKILNSEKYQCLIFGRNINDLRLNRDYIFKLKTDRAKKEINAISVFE